MLRIRRRIRSVMVLLHCSVLCAALIGSRSVALAEIRPEHGDEQAEPPSAAPALDAEVSEQSHQEPFGRQAEQASMGGALHPLWSPLLLPMSLIAPGSAQHLRGSGTHKPHYLSALASGAVFLASAYALVSSGAADSMVFPFIPFVYLSASSWIVLGLTDVVAATTKAPASVDSAEAVSPEITLFSAFRLRRVDDAAFETENYGEIELGWQATQSSGGFSYTRSGEQAIDFFGANVEIRPFPLPGSESCASQGIWALMEPERGFGFAFDYERERNRFGLFDKDRLTVLLHGSIPLGVWNSLLRRLWLEQNVGASQSWIHYDRGPGVRSPSDTVSSFEGRFDLRWWPYERLGFGFGYEHGRDSTTSPASGGFAGHWSSTLRVVPVSSFMVEATAHWGNSQIWDLALRMAF